MCSTCPRVRIMADLPVPRRRGHSWRGHAAEQTRSRCPPPPRSRRSPARHPRLRRAYGQRLHGVLGAVWIEDVRDAVLEPADRHPRPNRRDRSGPIPPLRRPPRSRRLRRDAGDRSDEIDEAPRIRTRAERAGWFGRPGWASRQARTDGLGWRVATAASMRVCWWAGSERSRGARRSGDARSPPGLPRRATGPTRWCRGRPARTAAVGSGRAGADRCWGG